MAGRSPPHAEEAADATDAGERKAGTLPGDITRDFERVSFAHVRIPGRAKITA